MTAPGGHGNLPSGAQLRWPGRRDGSLGRIGRWSDAFAQPLMRRTLRDRNRTSGRPVALTNTARSPCNLAQHARPLRRRPLLALIRPDRASPPLPQIKARPHDPVS